MADLNQTPSANRVHIAFFGKRNAGKSSVVNAVTGQNISIVSDVKGTTTDPVQKAMELLPLGPVVIIDTPGMDDEGTVGELRVQRARQVLNKADIAVLVIDGTAGKGAEDLALQKLIEKKGVPYIIVLNKADLGGFKAENDNEIAVSAKTGEHIFELKEKLAAIAAKGQNTKVILGDLLERGDHVVLVTPIDSSAPKGRMILPQVQAIRDILDADASCTVVKERELASTLKTLGKKPDLVVCDSQIVLKAAADTPDDVPLTTFSILMARFKGDLVRLAEGAARIDQLKPGDRVLIAEACTHHSMADDIGRVKIPRWFRQYAGGDIEFETMAGRSFPEDLSPYALVVQCGACTVNRKQVLLRIRQAERQGVPITNYGVAISRVQGVLHRSLGPFPSARIAFERANAAQ